MKRTIIISVAGLLVLGLVFFFYSRSGTKAQTPVETVAVTRGPVSMRVQSTATIKPENRLEIKPPIAGRAVSVEVDVGAKVKQGQVLAWMSSNERAALLDAAKAKGADEIKFWEDVYRPAPLVAPLDGEIISRTLVPGQVVQSTDVAFVMSDRLIARADMDETDLAKVFLQQDAEVILDSYPGQKIPGKVHKIAYDSTTTNSVTTYSVDVVLNQVPDFARSGMTAGVSFLVAEKKDALLLPSDAVAANKTVQVAAPGGEIKVQEVKTGISDGKIIEIVSGLSEGQKVYRSAYSLPETRKSGMTLLPSPGKGAGGGGEPPR